MKTAALEAGAHKSPLWGKNFPRIQIMTIEELLAGKKPDLPEKSGRLPNFAKAPRVKQNAQMALSTDGDDEAEEADT